MGQGKSEHDTVAYSRRNRLARASISDKVGSAFASPDGSDEYVVEKTIDSVLACRGARRMAYKFNPCLVCFPKQAYESHSSFKS